MKKVFKSVFTFYNFELSKKSQKAFLIRQLNKLTTCRQPQTNFKAGSKNVLGSTPHKNLQTAPSPWGEGRGEGSTLEYLKPEKAFSFRHLKRSKKSQKAHANAFTLAEVLITLAVIGVVAAMAIPSVISNAQQQEFKTGLRKAVSVLNSAITMNIALDGESPYDNGDLFRYLQRHMSVVKSSTMLPWSVYLQKIDGGDYRWSWIAGETDHNNANFYTTDGMRFEFWWANGQTSKTGYGWRPLHENANITPNFITTTSTGEKGVRCGSYGLNNPNNTTAVPCLIQVDVNGDRKPYPQYVNNTTNILKMVSPNSKKVRDTFTIMITDSAAIPYGVVAQKAMYQAQK